MSRRKSREKPLETMVVLALASLIAFQFFEFRWGLHLAGFLLFIGFFVPSVAIPISKGWISLGHIIGAVVGRVLMLVIFYLILTPLAFGYRLFKKEALMKTDKERESYFVTRNHKYVKEDLLRPW